MVLKLGRDIVNTFIFLGGKSGLPRVVHSEKDGLPRAVESGKEAKKHQAVWLSFSNSLNLLTVLGFEILFVVEKFLNFLVE